LLKAEGFAVADPETPKITSVIRTVDGWLQPELVSGLHQ
jgi:hypothetical protein